MAIIFKAYGKGKISYTEIVRLLDIYIALKFKKSRRLSQIHSTI